jgi:hypothetical protein
MEGGEGVVNTGCPRMLQHQKEECSVAMAYFLMTKGG